MRIVSASFVNSLIERIAGEGGEVVGPHLDADRAARRLALRELGGEPVGLAGDDLFQALAGL